MFGRGPCLCLGGMSPMSTGISLEDSSGVQSGQSEHLRQWGRLACSKDRLGNFLCASLQG